jgi:signal transduction histidine kinase/CHASE3 domain sensor protein
MKRSFDLVIHAGFGLALLILIAIGVVSYRSTNRLIDNNRWAAHSSQVIDRLHDLLEGVVNVETAGRAYLLEGSEYFLATHDTAVRSVQQAQEHLRTLISDNPDQQKRLVALEKPVADKLGWHRRLIELRQRQGFEAALVLFRTGRGQILMDEIKTRMEQMDAEERRELQRRNDQAEASATLSVQALLVGKVLAFALLLLIYYRLTREVSRRRLMQTELQKQTEILRSILANMGDGVVVADQAGRLVMFNPAAEQMFGPISTNSQSEEWSATYHLYLPDGVTPFPTDQLPLVRAMQGEEVNDLEMFVRPPDSPDGLWIRVTGRPLKDAQEILKGGVAVCRDITATKLAHESEIRKLNRELERRVVELTAVNSELEAFTYTVSHDLRAPLRQIDGFSRILLEEAGALSAQARHYLNRIRESSAKMGRMVDELLSLSRIGRRQLVTQPVELGAVVAEILRELQPELEGRQIEWRIGELPTAQCDAVLIRSVFANLLSNALKFSRTRPRAVIEVGQAPRGGGSAIFVRDNGVGFNMRYSNKLFGVFQRLHRQDEFEGTGVGLATVQRIVHKHGGEVWAESEPDRGATFYFTLGGPEEPAENRMTGASDGAR